MQMTEVVTKCYKLCDKCGIIIKNKQYDAFNFELEYKTGTAYPEGGSGDKYELDLCENCAPKAIQLLKENGFKVQESEWDW